MGWLSPGTHKISLIDLNGTESFDIVIEDLYPTHFNAEVPAAGSIQSGIGIIRGWACNATGVEVQIDQGLVFEAPYGGSRNDTQAICGDSDNGYAIAINWNEFSKGTHRIRTNFIGTGMSSDVEFEVLGLDESYIMGLSRSHVIPNFPTQGESVTVQWDEESQNFIIVGQD